mmetsp:Transcript_42155/g.120585  ORF Transcript_42155/g.120585 Transcript_42155/m.120585 type:complete len:284 (-) Transcript_42155:637-1488(-)
MGGVGAHGLQCRSCWFCGRLEFCKLSTLWERPGGLRKPGCEPAHRSAVVGCAHGRRGSEVARGSCFSCSAVGVQRTHICAAQRREHCGGGGPGGGTGGCADPSLELRERLSWSRRAEREAESPLPEIVQAPNHQDRRRVCDVPRRTWPVAGLRGAELHTGHGVRFKAAPEPGSEDRRESCSDGSPRSHHAALRVRDGAGVTDAGVSLRSSRGSRFRCADRRRAPFGLHAGHGEELDGGAARRPAGGGAAKGWRHGAACSCRIGCRICRRTWDRLGAVSGFRRV